MVFVSFFVSGLFGGVSFDSIVSVSYRIFLVSWVEIKFIISVFFRFGRFVYFRFVFKVGVGFFRLALDSFVLFVVNRVGSFFLVI